MHLCYLRFLPMGSVRFILLRQLAPSMIERSTHLDVLAFSCSRFSIS